MIRDDLRQVLLLQGMERAGSLRFIRQILPDPAARTPRRFVVDAGRGRVELLACEVDEWARDLEAARTVVPVPLEVC